MKNRDPCVCHDKKAKYTNNLEVLGTLNFKQARIERNVKSMEDSKTYVSRRNSNKI
jgi:hypothetical protein